jgi:hypothetical protein
MAYESAGFTQDQIDNYKNINDRGIGTPAPSAAISPTATSDYTSGPAGLKFQKPLISPELQGIIDKVTNVSSSMSPRQRSDIAHLAGVVGGLQQNRTNEQGQMARLGVTEASQANRFAATNTLAQGQLGIHQGQLAVNQGELALKSKPASPTLQKAVEMGIGADKKTAIGTGKKIEDEYPDIMNYFK